MLSIIAMVVGIVIAVTVHQFVYALTSAKLGDPLPKKEGRLTLNPLKHIEPVGFIILIISSFGWGKPVNTNPAYYKDKKKGTMIVAFSGIIANLCVAVIAGFTFRILGSLNIQISTINMFLIYIVQYNIVLAVVNLIPVYPLDGYRILLSFVKPSTYFKVIQYEKIIQMVLILLAFAGILSMFLNPIVAFLVNLIVI